MWVLRCETQMWTAWRRTVGHVCIRVSARSCKDSTPLSSIMWLLVCRQNSKPAWLVLKAEEEQKSCQQATNHAWLWPYHRLDCFLSFFLFTVALIVWVWVLFVIYLFIYWVFLLVTGVVRCHKLLASFRITNEVQPKPIMLKIHMNLRSTVKHIYVWFCFVAFCVMM